MTSVLDVLFLTTGLLSAVLAFLIASLMFRSFSTIRVDYLVGFPAGFSLLGLSFIFFDLSYAVPLPNTISWAPFVLGSYGFAFLAMTYFLKKRGGASSWSVRQFFSILAILAVVTVLFISGSSLPPISSFQSVEIVFRVVNLVFLGYIIFSLNQALRTEAELSNVVLGFTFLSIDQYSLLLWALDPGFVWSLFFAQLVRVAGLVILAVFLVKGLRRM